MNQKGDVNDIITALVGLFIVLLVYYVVMVMWQPITSTLLFPLLNNAEAFPQGGVSVTLFNLLPLVAVAMIFIWFFNQARGERRPPTAFA